MLPRIVDTRTMLPPLAVTTRTPKEKAHRSGLNLSRKISSEENRNLFPSGFRQFALDALKNAS
jgi:hypothetical protein